MWTPDIRTLFVVLFLVNAFLTLLLFLFWVSQRTYPGFRTWMLSLLAISCGYFLLALRDSVPVLFSIIAANTLIVLSVAMRFDSIKRLFWSKSLPLIFYSIIAMFVGFFIYVTYFFDSILFRNLIINVFIVPILLITGFIAIQFQDPKTRSLRFGFAITLIIPAILLTARNIYWLFTPGDHSVLSTDPLNTLLFVVTLITDILSTGFFLILNMARSQTELQASEIRLAEAQHIAHLGSWDWNFITNKSTWSNEMYRLFGISPDTYDGTPESVLKVIHPDDKEKFIRNMENNLSHGETAPLEYRVIRPGGEVRTLYAQGVIAFDKAGKPVRNVGTVQDITDQKQFEDAIRLTNRKLAILSSITRHDFKNQLLSIRAYLELSKNYINDPAKISEFIEKEERIANTIEHQIDFTKEYENLGVNAPVWQTCRTLVDTAEKQVSSGKIVVKNIIPVESEVFADPLIVKVFYNLIDNAVRYGGKITTIRFSLQESGDNHIIVCEDDGAGIPAEEKEKIFERGFGKNTGLGLFLAREILDITGITIRETGEPGKGARFEMKVPKGAYRM